MVELPTDIRVLERGWLSSNSILLLDHDHADLVDSGYVSHASQTLLLVQHECEGRPLRTLVNTHLHSDHCGGNSALQSKYLALATYIPPGLAPFIDPWNPDALSYTPTGQQCPPFSMDGVLVPGQSLQLGQHHWDIHAAPGHDPDSVILFEPKLRLLISADALWEQGFGVVFPEIEGHSAFDDVSHTLDLIEALQPACVIPGHGRVFTDVGSALQTARQRLASFVNDPRKHARHAAKVLLKFKLLEQQQMGIHDMYAWAAQTSYIKLLHDSHFASLTLRAWCHALIEELTKVGAAEIQGERIVNR